MIEGRRHETLHGLEKVNKNQRERRREMMRKGERLLLLLVPLVTLHLRRSGVQWQVKTRKCNKSHSE